MIFRTNGEQRNKSSRVASILGAMLLALPLAGAEEPGAESWARAMLARRAALRENTPARESAWHTVGPFKARSFSEAFFPEKKVDLEEKTGNGKRNLWSRKDYPNGVVNPLKMDDGTALYLYRTLVAREAGKLKIGLGSDDGLEFWFNGKKLVSNNAARGVVPDQEVVPVELRRGTNEVLLKIYNQTGDSGFYYNSGSSVRGAMAGLAGKYPVECRLFARQVNADQWFQGGENTSVEQGAIRRMLDRLPAATAEKQAFDGLVKNNTPSESPAWLELIARLAAETGRFDEAQARLQTVNTTALRLAVEDLCRQHPQRYQGGPGYLAAIEDFEKELPRMKAALDKGDTNALGAWERFKRIEREALLANPALDFDRILLVKRHESNLGLPQNWQGNSSLNPHVENEIDTLSLKEAAPALKQVYKPATNCFVGDVDLNYDADKMLFSSIGSNRRWQVFEIGVNGAGLRQVTPSDETDIDSYDPMYLPDGRIIFDSTSTFQGVPCVGGADYVANLHIMNPDGTGIRRLCYDQDNDWCPVMLPNGRVMYLRWEYTDTAHYFSRVLMSMNPDGTGQVEFYGSGSYWPNSLFYARPLPGSETRFVGIVGGHHGVPRMGEMVLFDVAKGRKEDSGAVQRIPGCGKPVQGVIKDSLVDGSWPKFLHPHPLTDRHFLVSCKPNPQSPWGIYLVDVFDNMLLLKEEPGYALLEPIPLHKTERPPVIQDKIRPGQTNATVYMHNVYMGDGLKEVPPGTVKSLRIYQYEFSYRNQGGHYFVGMEGGWDVRRIIGTVPVKEDGSALFTVPANTPVAVQPLDGEGKALQLMRSWFVGMPGEFVSCVGCHERQNSSSTLKIATAARGIPAEPTPWRGPKRGFSFIREVQPVLDKYCVGCHDGREKRPNFSDPTIIPTSGGIARLPRSYVDLHPYIHRNGPEGDYHTLTPLQFHADTSLLVQMLRRGHHNVKLDEEAWDRLITWIDLNVVAHGTFHEAASIPSNYEKRRYEAKKKYAGVDEDIEAIDKSARQPIAFVQPDPEPPRPAPVTVAGWPFDPARAARMQAALGATEEKLDLGNGEVIALRRIPSGEFAMGDVRGEVNEFPMVAARIARPFWMAATEISLKQYQQFDPLHRNGYYDMHYKDQVRPGYLMDFPQKPAIRVSWNQAMEFCRWLSARTGRKVILPTEAQWEWACRAGTATPMFYGDLDTDFGGYANLADVTMRQLAVSGVDPQPISNPDKFWDYVPKEPRFSDGVLHLADCGKYKPNAWGLHDMIGNVGEWTLDDYSPQPRAVAPMTAEKASASRKVVRGGSWAERPKDSRASSRLDYPAWQRVYNVGFRIVVLD